MLNSETIHNCYIFFSLLPTLFIIVRFLVEYHAVSRCRDVRLKNVPSYEAGVARQRDVRSDTHCFTNYEK